MKVADIMTSGAAAVRPETSLADAVNIMIQHHISGLPVTDPEGRLVGILTEGDLLRRVEFGTERQRPRWIEFFRTAKLAEEYTQTHGRRVGEVMTPSVVTIPEDAPLQEAVRLMELHRVKRLPVVSGGKLVGILSRADLLPLLGRLIGAAAPDSETDAAIRGKIRAEIRRQSWVPRSVKFVVHDGVVELLGVIFDERSRPALTVLAENVPGVKSVVDHLIWVEPMSGIAMVEPIPLVDRSEIAKV